MVCQTYISRHKIPGVGQSFWDGGVLLQNSGATWPPVSPSHIHPHTRTYLFIHTHAEDRAGWGLAWGTGNAHGRGAKAEHADLEERGSEQQRPREAASDSPNHGGDLDTKVRGWMVAPLLPATSTAHVVGRRRKRAF
jgi:hypothetical protein